MPAYKNETTGKWYCKFYYKDWQGNSKQKKKSGFELRRDALEYERKFLEQYKSDPDITVSALCDKYLYIQEPRLKPLSYKDREVVTKLHIKPVIGDMLITDVTPLTIEEWQKQLLEKGLASSTVRHYYTVLRIIFNFAVSHYGLQKSPCANVKSICKETKKDIAYITLEEFKTIERAGTMPPQSLMMLKLLFWTGMRFGELSALTPSDFKGNAISITKNRIHYNGQYIIQDTPKTDSSIRKVYIHQSLADDFNAYIDMLYKIGPADLIFTQSKTAFMDHLEKALAAAGIKRIRIHDLRHSHVSLLIHLGYSPTYIGERIGDTAETVLRVYAHVYEADVNKLLDELSAMDK